MDFLVFWEIPSEQRTGFVLLSGVNLGAGHAALQEAVENVESAKVKRSMYAETQREKMEMLQSIRASEWNAEMNPLVVTTQEGVVEHDFSRGCVCHIGQVSRAHSCQSLSCTCEILFEEPFADPPIPLCVQIRGEGRGGIRAIASIFF